MDSLALIENAMILDENCERDIIAEFWRDCEEVSDEVDELLENLGI